MDDITKAISAMEGFGVALSLSTRNANPGNIRSWKKEGIAYPTRKGFVNFMAWAHGDKMLAENEGWRVLKTLVHLYLDGRYTGGKSPSLNQMFAKYAPDSDGNHSAAYAAFVAKRVGVLAEKPLADYLVDEGV
ncbi:MAG: hypothetical protein ABFE08_09075 [Armatimonadia bacterium]